MSALERLYLLDFILTDINVSRTTLSALDHVGFRETPIYFKIHV